MEYVEGPTLGEVMERHRLPLAQGLYILGQVLEGLTYLHGRRGLDGTPLGLVHRDISPQNVLLSIAGAVKLIDFGIAKAFNAVDTPESAEGPKGRFAYMSPEQAYGLALDSYSICSASGCSSSRFAPAAGFIPSGARITSSA